MRISSLDCAKSLDIDAVVGTEAMFTMLPAPMLHDLGIEPTGKNIFMIADGGRRIYADCGQAWATINGESVMTLVAFGEDNSPPILGIYTLQGLALAVDHGAQRLVPTKPIIR